MSSIMLRPHQENSLYAMNCNDTGKIIMGTGAGKSIVFIKNTINQLTSSTPQTVCIVAPRIILACQLSQDYEKHITNAKFIHIHSGAKLKHYRTTNPKDIQDWFNIHHNHHKLIFTSYNSLKKVIASGIKVDTYHFDEAHNSVKRNFFPHVEEATLSAKKKYFFTATPKNTLVPTKKPGMNMVDVYGNTICEVPMTQMIDDGFVVPPLIVKKEIDDNDNVDERNCDTIISTINEEGANKILVAAKSTKSIISLICGTDFAEQLKERGYSLLHITSQHGAYIDGKSVKRDAFFRILNEWGNDDEKKFVLLNYSILSEGVNCNGLDCVIFMRNMDPIAISQTVGRIIRLHKDDADKISKKELEVADYKNYKKGFGLVVLPIYNEYSSDIASCVETIINKSFIFGETISVDIEK